MKRFLIQLTIVALALLLACGCNDSREPEADAPPDTQLEQPAGLPEITPIPQETPIPEVTPSATVEQTAAHTFSVNGKRTLYAAIEVKNTSAIPIVIKQIDVEFSDGSSHASADFTPILYNDDVIQPGGVSDFAVWLPTEKEFQSQGLNAEARLVCEPWSSSLYKPLAVTNLFIAQNYPGFASVSGELINETDNDYSLSVVYVSFFNAENKLLGTWHFSRNLSIPAGESRNFVNHMQELPIEGLAEETDHMVARGIGIT